MAKSKRQEKENGHCTQSCQSSQGLEHKRSGQLVTVVVERDGSRVERIQEVWYFWIARSCSDKSPQAQRSKVNPQLADEGQFSLHQTTDLRTVANLYPMVRKSVKLDKHSALRKGIYRLLIPDASVWIDILGCSGKAGDRKSLGSETQRGTLSQQTTPIDVTRLGNTQAKTNWPGYYFMVR